MRLVAAFLVAVALSGCSKPEEKVVQSPTQEHVREPLRPAYPAPRPQAYVQPDNRAYEQWKAQQDAAEQARHEAATRPAGFIGTWVESKEPQATYEIGLDGQMTVLIVSEKGQTLKAAGPYTVNGRRLTAKLKMELANPSLQSGQSLDSEVDMTVDVMLADDGQTFSDAEGNVAKRL